MNAASSREVLQLYRKLLRYGKELKLTDQNYYRRRIRKEFKTNQELQSDADIQFHIEVISSHRHIIRCICDKNSF